MRKVMLQLFCVLLAILILEPLAGTVQAANIGRLPYSNDNNSLSDATYSSWVNPADTNMDATWYGTTPQSDGTIGRVLDIMDDPDSASGHGKVLRMSNTMNSNLEGFLAYTIPEQTSGKLAVQFDIKLEQGGFLQLSLVPSKYNSTGYNPAVSMSNGMVTCAETTTVGSHQYGKWYTIRVLSDIDNKTHTVYFDDKVVTDGFYAYPNKPNVSIGYLKFRNIPGSVTYLDNIRINTLSDTAVVNLQAEGQPVHYFVPCTDTLQLRLDEWDFGELPEDGIQLLDLGSNPITLQENPVPLTVQQDETGVNLKLSSPLQDGCRYMLRLSEDVQSAFGQTLDKRSIMLRASASGSSDASDVTQVQLIDMDGETLFNEGGKAVCPEIQRIDVAFSGSMQGKPLSDITLTDTNGVPVEYRGSWDNSSGVWSMTLPQYLAQNTDYTLTVPSSVVPTPISGIIQTGEGRYEILSFTMKDSAGKNISNLSGMTGNQVILEAKVLNTQGRTDSLSVVYTAHQGYLMKNLQYQDFSLTPASRVADLRLTVTQDALSQMSDIKGFLWSDMQNITPRSAGLVVQGSISTSN